MIYYTSSRSRGQTSRSPCEVTTAKIGYIINNSCR